MRVHPQTYLQLREHYLHERDTHTYLHNRMRASSALSVTRDEWTDVDHKWQTVSDEMTKWSHKLENHLPGKLSELVHWIVSGESLLTTTISLRPTEPSKTLATLDTIVARTTNHFADVTGRYAQFYGIYRTGKVDGRAVPAEFLDPLNARFLQLNEQSPEHIKWLQLLQAEYKIRGECERLTNKMHKWQRPLTLQAAHEHANECEVKEEIMKVRFQNDYSV
jgi:hypothetical protein